MTETAYPRRAYAPSETGIATDSTSAPSRAIISIERKPSTVKVGLAAVAIGAVTTSAGGAVMLTSTTEAAANVNVNAGATTDAADVTAARQARPGAIDAFASRSGDRAPQQNVAGAVSLRNASLSATSQQVSATHVKSVISNRNQALAANAQKVTQEETRRRSDGWLPGGKNPSFLRPVQGGALTSPFGWRSSPFGGGREMHTGQDIALSCGSPIRATQDGTVTYNGYMGSAGNTLKIQHGRYNGKDIMSGYYHAQSYTVSVGQKVSRGQLIGYVGTTGASTGCHLHFLIWENGTNVDPMPYVTNSGAVSNS